MPMYLEDFINEKTLQPMIAERIRRYEKKAIAFLRDQFAPAIRVLSDDEVRAVVQLAYKNAKKRGIQTERDHLKYLIPVMFWGSYFERDPQYLPELSRAGWVDEDGNLSKHIYMPQLLTEIDHRTLSVAPDLASYKRIMSGFREIYTEALPAKLTFRTLSEIMAYIWPSHYKMAGQDCFLALAENGVSRGKSLLLETRDIIAYSCLSVYFGHMFDECPRFPWAVYALAKDGKKMDERRRSLWRGVENYFENLMNQK